MRPTLILLSCLLFAACARQPDDEAIRAAITAGAAAIEAHRGKEVLDLVTEDFVGNDGVDRAGLANVLRAQLLGANALGVRIGSVAVELHGDRAVARFDADITDSSGRWIADRATTVHFETGWRREDGAWRCYNAKWSDGGS
ncbi:MAG: nuclear transport factor 2 family protein [Dokdonella sp.]|uniref:nuclear transport factor 2 family protein n=1 Tax=Dokdonella sp. TaxID=2291710 RepID=UPI003F7FD82E